MSQNRPERPSSAFQDRSILDRAFLQRQVISVREAQSTNMLQPGVYPQHCSRPTSSAAEMKLYAALKDSLPKGWYAWHSLRVLVDGGWEGEGDFVIAVPDRGMLILEVKGGQVTVRDGIWLQNSRPMAKSPRDQGNRFCRLLLDRLKQRGCQPPAYGVATCFPDTPFDAPPSQGDLSGTVLGEQDLAWLGDALKALVDRALPKPGMSKGNWIEALHTLWGATWTPRPRLGDRVRLDSEDRLRLDAQQLALLSCLEQNRQILVDGAAGTGKTVLAREAAIREVNAGRKVLVLCFTEALAQWLKTQTECDGLHVAPIKRFSVELMRLAGIEVKVEDNAAFWSEITLRAAVEALPVTGQRWDSIIIDEGQDLMEEDWQLVFELSRGRRLWVFRDSEQAFWPERKFPEEQFQACFRLTATYRCPNGILQLALAYLGHEIAVEPIREAIEQGVIGIVACPSQSSVPEKLAGELRKLRSGGIDPADVAVLSLRGLHAKGVLAQHGSLDGHSMVKADCADLEGKLVGDSFLRFKGLERPAILISDMGLVENRMGTRMHIALTRAMSIARIVATKQDLAADPVLRRIGLKF